MRFDKFFNRRSRSLRTKLVIFLMMLGALSTVVTAVVFTAYELNSAKETESHRIHSIGKILAPNLTASMLFQDTNTAQELIAPLITLDGITRVVIYDTHGEVFLMLSEKDKKVIQQEKLTRFITSLTLEDESYGKLVIWVDDTQQQQAINSYLYILLMMLAISLIVSFIASLSLSQIFTKPIIGLADIAKQITQSHNYQLRAIYKNRDELGVLTHCFNTMLENVEQRDIYLESQVQKRTHELNVSYTQLQNANSLLKDQAYRDDLSGLPNRRFMYEKIEDWIKSEYISSFALLYLDLDGFKEVNDNLGHDAGDDLIRITAMRLSHTLRSEDVLARLGGDEFTVLLKDMHDIEQLTYTADDILETLAQPFDINGESVKVTASIGICQYPEAGVTTEEMFKNADIAMYESKAAGRNRICFFTTEMQEKVHRKKQMLNDLHKAIKNREFELYFQPITNMLTNEVEKAEALIRWNHPEKGMIPPDQFISLAEESGLIDEIGCWINEEAFKYAQRLQEIHHRPICISINVSPVQFTERARWLTHFMQCLESSNVIGSAISIEITENLLMSSDKVTINKLRQLEEKGVQIAIDDFGVGYSSLSYLLELRTDILKIDQRFVQSLQTNTTSSTLCQALLAMATGLNMKVIAEGIETQQQKEQLKSYGYIYGQGYLFSRPLPFSEFEKYLLQEELEVTSPSVVSIH